MAALNQKMLAAILADEAEESKRRYMNPATGVAAERAAAEKGLGVLHPKRKDNLVMMPDKLDKEQVDMVTRHRKAGGRIVIQGPDGPVTLPGDMPLLEFIQSEEFKELQRKEEACGGTDLRLDNIYQGGGAGAYQLVKSTGGGGGGGGGAA
eukprot:CAMPEP_0119492046 /NCGR_PEP_ID=MMETSP1344-20130328/16727_1 /TAXON_ID=236787 /ORGANISM="Florenciella parvula, Strain CCMP2471" /LENGTH=150 /DNA_ID=CAMNT_0007527355 /DNA_START=58 /DNA_END=506 /DNA_ORIENTATION=-